MPAPPASHYICVRARTICSMGFHWDRWLMLDHDGVGLVSRLCMLMVWSHLASSVITSLVGITHASMVANALPWIADCRM